MSKIITLVHLLLFASLFITSSKAKVKGKVENQEAKEGEPITQKAEKKEGGSDYIFGPIPGESSFT